MNASLEQSLNDVLNSFCEENKSNTPDFVLAKFLLGCLESFHLASNLREQWYGRMTEDMEDTIELFDTPTLTNLDVIDDIEFEPSYDCNSINDVVSTNFLEEKRFTQTDYVHLSVMLMDLEDKPGMYYDFFDDMLLVLVVRDNGLTLIKSDPLVRDVLEMLK
jgi:hypothetical protein